MRRPSPITDCGLSTTNFGRIKKMGTTRLFRIGVLALGLVAFLSSYGLATERAPGTDISSFSDANAITPPMTGAPSTDLVRASRVVDTKIKSPDGTTLGNVTDIVLAPDLDSVSYVVLSRGGMFGMGTQLYAIPWSALSAGVNGAFVIPVTEQQLEQSQGFDPDNWPSRPSAAWAVQDQLSSTQDINGGSVFPRRFTRLKGTNVKAAEGDKVGDIRDFAIAMDTGQIAYTIVSHGGLLGMGQKLAAIPQNAITLEPALGLAHVNASKAVVEANSFPSGHWPGLGTPSYSQQVARAYGVEPVGTTLAYVPPEGTTAVARAPRTTTTTPPARSTTPPVSDTTAAMAEPTSAELTGTFNPSNITTIEGTVIALGKFQPATGSEMLWLRVRPQTGQPVLVNLGPRSYISAENFYIVSGDRIHLTGSQVASTASGKQVFLPTEIRYNGQTLRLRSATGTPLWEGAAGAAATPPLGYTPAESQATAGTGAAAAQPPTEFTPSGIVAIGAFDLSTSQTIEGTVTEIGRSEPARGESDVIWLRIRTMEGQTVNVQVGPRDYVSRQNFFVVNGDRVRLTGWNARISGVPSATPVFILADITQNGNTLQLRNRNGEPLWTSPAGRAERSQRDTMDGTSAGRSQEATTPGTADTARSDPTTEPSEPDEP
jgi:sporulation protein YlmC with PRC-barrel domain